MNWVLKAAQHDVKIDSPILRKGAVALLMRIAFNHKTQFSMDLPIWETVLYHDAIVLANILYRHALDVFDRKTFGSSVVKNRVVKAPSFSKWSELLCRSLVLDQAQLQRYSETKNVLLVVSALNKGVPKDLPVVLRDVSLPTLKFDTFQNVDKVTGLDKIANVTLDGEKQYISLSIPTVPSKYRNKEVDVSVLNYDTSPRINYANKHWSNAFRDIDENTINRITLDDLRGCLFVDSTGETLRFRRGIALIPFLVLAHGMETKLGATNESIISLETGIDVSKVTVAEGNGWWGIFSRATKPTEYQLYIRDLRMLMDFYRFYEREPLHLALGHTKKYEENSFHRTFDYAGKNNGGGIGSDCVVRWKISLGDDVHPYEIARSSVDIQRVSGLLFHPNDRGRSIPEIPRRPRWENNPIQVVELAPPWFMETGNGSNVVEYPSVITLNEPLMQWKVNTGDKPIIPFEVWQRSSDKSTLRLLTDRDITSLIVTITQSPSINNGFIHLAFDENFIEDRVIHEMREIVIFDDGNDPLPIANVPIDIVTNIFARLDYILGVSIVIGPIPWNDLDVTEKEEIVKMANDSGSGHLLFIQQVNINNRYDYNSFQNRPATIDPGEEVFPSMMVHYFQMFGYFSSKEAITSMANGITQEVFYSISNSTIPWACK